MMNGMGMLLDALGVNVQEMKIFVDGLPTQVKRLQDSYSSIEAKLDRIESALFRIIKYNEALAERILNHAGINGSGNADGGD